MYGLLPKNEKERDSIKMQFTKTEKKVRIPGGCARWLWKDKNGEIWYKKSDHWISYKDNNRVMKKYKTTEKEIKNK